MLTKEKIDRINTLAKKSKLKTLTQEEKKEQSALREEYLKHFREHFRGLKPCRKRHRKENRKYYMAA